MIEEDKRPGVPRHLLNLEDGEYLLGEGKPASFNVAQNFAHESDFVLDLFQQMAAQTLTVEQRRLAQETGLALASKGTVSLGALAKVWESEPSLREFAATLLDAAMPGPRGAIFRESKEPLKVDPLDQTDHAAFERLALNTRRLTESEFSKPWWDWL